MTRRVLALLAPLALVACAKESRQPVRVEVIAEPAPHGAPLHARLTARLIGAATVGGLVAIDGEGRVVPSIADRWTVTDDGESYIFRLRTATWPDGARLDGASAAAALRQALAAQRDTALGLDLAVVESVQAMAARVVEVRLARPVPDFLQLLAQPELGLRRHGQGAGPMRLREEGTLAWLSILPPERAAEDSAETLTRPVALSEHDARAAVADFVAGRTDVVLGGTFADLPLATAWISGKDTLRRETPAGLFGLQVTGNNPLLASPAVRGALAMAIDRATLARRLGLSATTRLLPDDPIHPRAERWADQDMTARRAVAAQQIAAWQHQQGSAVHQAPHLRLALPHGPGADLLARLLAADLAAIGVEVERVEPGANADLRLVDELARYPALSWYFNQLHCKLRQPCSPEADELAAQAMQAAPDAPAPIDAPSLYAAAENAVLAANVFIPLGGPLRWSLAAPGLPGFAANPGGVHPLYPLAARSR